MGCSEGRVAQFDLSLPCFNKTYLGLFLRVDLTYSHLFQTGPDLFSPISTCFARWAWPTFTYFDLLRSLHTKAPWTGHLMNESTDSATARVWDGDCTESSEGLARTDWQYTRTVLLDRCMMSRGECLEQDQTKHGQANARPAAIFQERMEYGFESRSLRGRLSELRACFWKPNFNVIFVAPAAPNPHLGTLLKKFMRLAYGNAKKVDADQLLRGCHSGQRGCRIGQCWPRSVQLTCFFLPFFLPDQCSLQTSLNIPIILSTITQFYVHFLENAFLRGEFGVAKTLVSCWQPTSS